MRSSRRAAVVAVGLVPLGTVAGHVGGYVLAGEDASLAGGHAHLAPGAWVTAIVAVAALAWVAAGRSDGAARPRVGRLAAVQAALFLGLEAVEHVVAGHGPASVLHEPVVRWGVAAQVAAAALLVALTRLARAAGDRVRAVLGARRRPIVRPAVPRPAPSCRAGTAAAASPASERGPPALLVPA